MIFQENFFSCYILLTDQISLTGCLYFLRFWAIYPLQLFIQVKTFFLDTHKVSLRSDGVCERVVIAIKDTSNQSIKGMCAWFLEKT